MTQRRLIVSLLLFFVALALPSSILVYQAYGQLKWEAFYQHQRLARELTLRIDSGFRDLIEREEKRPISDYEFLNVAGSDEAAFLQRSPLSDFPLKSDIPGLLGYFQVDSAGRLRTPLVPSGGASNYGISSAELAQRRQQEGRIRGILDRNRLVGKSDEPGVPELEEVLAESRPEAIPGGDEDASLESRKLYSIASSEENDSQGQAAFDALSSSRLESAEQGRAPLDQVGDLELADSYDVAGGVSAAAEPAGEEKQQDGAKRSRKEKVNLPRAIASEAPPALEKNLSADAAASPAEAPLRQQTIRIQTFESEVEALEFALLDS
ncbi:MAG TPA: hypothetical protein VKQ06_04750, partial [Gammaproteobacteria bacterium]|nr:hypothetical protein [Gammaproteobacteria bacterium]